MRQYSNIQEVQAIKLQEAQKIGSRGGEFIPNIHKKNQNNSFADNNSHIIIK
jgi:hypothetical protein